MINFFQNKESGKTNINKYSKRAALLIHAAKIDEVFEEKEKNIIKRTLIELGAETSKLDKFMEEALIIEENSNQILDFTKEVKNISYSNKVKIIESLWKIIYSDNSADIYETNLMRRLGGLLYIEPKTMGDLKEKIKKELGK